MEDKYNKRLVQYQSLWQKDTKTFDTVGNIKVFLTILFLTALFFSFFRGFSSVFFVCAILLLGFLICFWIYHIKIRDRINYAEGIIALNKKDLNRIAGTWTDFPDTGEEFIEKDHPYALDLDIVGKNSLFQLLNLTNTWHGRKALADDLLHSCYNMPEILSRQEAIQELSQDISFSHEFQYYASKIGVKYNLSEQLQSFGNEQSKVKSRALKNILLYAPFFTLPFILGVFLFQVQIFYLPAVFILVVQTLIWGWGIIKFKSLKSALKINHDLGSYSKVLELLQNKKFNSAKLKSIQKDLTLSESSAAQAIAQLDKIIGRIMVRQNFIVYYLLNSLLLWDIRCAFDLEAWIEKFALPSEKWVRALGEFESLLSFSNLANINDHVCFPELVQENKIDASEMGHPLLPNASRIYNDFAAGKEIFIISGSNMSGKTTFLRTLGVNLILSQNGSAVCAAKMSNSLFQIVTSMRISDDLNEGISTFYAELKRIKFILDTAKIHKNLLFLIDEIFQGTNSVDRLLGAQTVITKLKSLGVTGLITTHDLELCQLESQGGITNLSFAEAYTQNTISFDYKLQKGKSTTTNAKYLMEMVGIMDADL